MSVTKPPAKPSGPKLDRDTEWSVEIILVRDEVVLRELGKSSLDTGPVATVTLAQVAKHIGQPHPTDIVVFARRPWHFAGPPSQPAALHAHPQVHADFPETVLVLSQHDRAVWWSKDNFAITDIRPATHGHSHPLFPEAATTPPQYPFAAAPVTRVEQNLQGVDIFVARSTEPIAGTEKHMYKIEFAIGGNTIDPDMYCAP